MSDQEPLATGGVVRSGDERLIFAEPESDGCFIPWRGVPAPRSAELLKGWIMTVPTPPPTQTRHPWRATARTVLAAGFALLPMLPTIAETAHVQTVPIVGGVLVVTGAVTRVLAMPGVDGWLRKYVPFLAASK